MTESRNSPTYVRKGVYIFGTVTTITFLLICINLNNTDAFQVFMSLGLGLSASLAAGY